MVGSLSKTLAAFLLAPDELAAARNLAFELRLSRAHRKSLKKIETAGRSRPAKLNLGCGDHPKEGFLNVDVAPGADLALDLRRPLPFEANSCDLIFSEHFFEHIDYPERVGNLFRECLRVLKPGGELRISVPDTQWPLTDYVQPNDYLKACEENSWHPPECTTRLEHINYHFRQNGEHRFAYDEETMTKALSMAGFTNIRRGSFDASLDSQHRKVGSLIMCAAKAQMPF